VRLCSIQAVGSLHTKADVDTDKGRERQEMGLPSSEPEAAVVHQGRRQLTKDDGTAEQQDVTYPGYKTDVSMGGETGLVTTFKPAVGNSPDNKQFLGLGPAMRA
jgi:hypothetical protein